jgi:hypothetical protein
MYVGKSPDEKDEIEKNGITLSEKNILPLLPGKSYLDSDGNDKVHRGVRLGYPVDFLVTTNGDLYDDNDMVYIKPTFSYVPSVAGVPDMTLRQDVDLYISSYQGIKSFETDLILTSEARDNIGDLLEKSSTISDENKEKSVQQWKGRYFLPNMTYALPAGTNINTLGKVDIHKAPFLHDGFIIMNFEIVVYDNVSGLTDTILSNIGNLKTHLKLSPEHIVYGIGWQEEEYELNQLGQSLRYGDIIFYSTDKRASETYY